MKYTYATLVMILFGCLGLLIIVMFESITLNNDSEYYVLKEAMEAAMLDSIDMDCYRISDRVNTNSCFGSIKISEQKFVENFTRRFFANISGDVTDYKLEFYDIIESPPKATVVIKAKTQKYSFLDNESGDGTFQIVNKLTGILEFTDKNPDFTVLSEDSLPETVQADDGSLYTGAQLYNWDATPNRGGVPDGNTG